MACPLCGETSVHEDWPISVEVKEEAVQFATETPGDAVVMKEVPTVRCSECSTRFYEDPNRGYEEKVVE